MYMPIIHEKTNDFQVKSPIPIKDIILKLFHVNKKPLLQLRLDKGESHVKS